MVMMITSLMEIMTRIEMASKIMTRNGYYLEDTFGSLASDSIRCDSSLPKFCERDHCLARDEFV